MSAAMFAGLMAVVGMANPTTAWRMAIRSPSIDDRFRPQRPR